MFQLQHGKGYIRPMSTSIDTPRATEVSVIASHLNASERQARFVEWMTAMFARAAAQGLTLDRPTDFEIAWIGRM
jgi:hypothetical protein